MPRIPTGQNQVSLNAAPNVQVARQVSTVGDSLAQAASNVGNVVSQIQAEERNKATKAQVFDADGKLSQLETSLLYDPTNGAKTKRGEAAFDLPSQVLPEYDKQTTELEKGIQSTSGKRVFREAATQRRNQITAQLNQWEGSERERYYADKYTSYREQEQNAAGLAYRDPKAIAAALERQDASVGAQFEKQSPETVAVGKLENRAKTYSKVFDQILADGDLGYATSYFEQVKGDIDSELQTRIKSGIATLAARKQSEARAAQAEQRDTLTADVQDAFAARQMGIPAVLPPRSRFVAAFGEDGTKRYQAAAGQWKAYDAAGIAATMPPGEAMQFMDSLKPTSQSGAADQKDAYDLAVKLYAQQRDRLEKDPVSTLLTTNKELADLQQQAADDPTASAAYFKKLLANQQVLGVPEPKLLSDGQRAAMAQQLDFNPEEPAARSNRLAGMKATYGDFYPQIMREVAPKLEGQARVMIDMEPNQATRLDAATAQQKELNDLVKGQNATDINDQLDMEFESLAVTLADNVDSASRLAEFRNSAELLAKADVLRGTPPQEAARKAAAAVVNDQYNYVGSMRIPVAYDAGLVSRGASLVQQELGKTGEFAIAGNSAAQSDLRSLVQRQGYWVTNESGTGMVLRIPHRTGMGDVYVTQQPTKTHDGFPAVKNPDGSVSTEISVTVTDPRLNDGKPTNIPSLWGGKVRSNDEAVGFALKSGKKYDTFDSVESAVGAAQLRSQSLGAKRVEYLWDQFIKTEGADKKPSAFIPTDPELR